MYRTPSLQLMSNGTLLAFTQCRQTSKGDASPQSLYLKRSHDNGATWSEAMVLPFAVDAALDTQHRAQTVRDATTDTVFLFDDARPVGSSGACAVQVWATRDLGNSWDLITNLTEANETGSGLATGIQLPTRRLVTCLRVGCNGNASGNANPHAMISDDGGATWRAGSPGPAGDAQMNECLIAPLSNGSLLMNARSSSSNARLVARSDDEGETWTAPRTVSELASSATCEASLYSFQNALYFSHPQEDRKSNSVGRTHLTVRRSTDDGATWPAEDATLVYAGGSAYSALGQTADGRLAVLFEKDDSDLGFAIVNM